MRRWRIGAQHAEGDGVGAALAGRGSWGGDAGAFPLPLLQGERVRERVSRVIVIPSRGHLRGEG